MFDSLKNSQIVPTKTLEMKPISAQDRFPIIDVLRGVAILCILFLNMFPFSFPENFRGFYLKMFNGMGNTIIYELVEFFGRGKFYSMLAFLFGLGMAVQVSRSLDTDKKFTWFYSRRLLLLLAIGLFHDLFIWGGIILIIYSTMGFFLLFFKKRRPKTLLTWAVIFFLIPVLINVVFPHKKPAPPANVNQQQAEDIETKKVQEVIKIYQEGSYGDMFHLRVQKLKRTLLITARAGWDILALFLLGIWAWQKRIFQDLEKNLKFLKKTGWFSLALGLGGTAIPFFSDKLFNPGQSLAVEIIGVLLHTIGTTALSFFYIIS
ncbi:MAG TPA: hypothetical protein VK186_27945, partial [Candidatus Deferrimicrobium sp.]|nr:hypothetical protein [Candidatus Deferrimicrobium sp.]